MIHDRQQGPSEIAYANATMVPKAVYYAIWPAATSEPAKEYK